MLLMRSMIVWWSIDSLQNDISFSFPVFFIRKVDQTVTVQKIDIKPTEAKPAGELYHLFLCYTNNCTYVMHC